MLQSTEQLKTSIAEILPDSPLFPTEWKEFSDAPKALYALGNTALLTERKLCIVGSRRTSANALKVGEQIAETISSSLVIVTGTADGGDTAAIEGALRGGGRIICLLAGGFGEVPQGNLPLLEKVAKQGLLLSPHAFDAPVRTFSYEYRNKLLAALCEGVLVLGAGEKSGALITAKYAVKFERFVFAIPYPPNSLAGIGCNELIKRGGYLTENAEDVASVLEVDLQTKPRPTLTPDEELVYNALQELEEGHVSEISAKVGMPIFKAKAVLSALEVKGFAVSGGGNRYTPV